MEIRYKASKQEVERAIFALDGDLEKAEESLKAQKQDPPVVPLKPDETGSSYCSQWKTTMIITYKYLNMQALKKTPPKSEWNTEQRTRGGQVQELVLLFPIHYQHFCSLHLPQQRPLPFCCCWK